MLTEFRIIEKYFKRPVPNDVVGIGDDGAILPIANGEERLVITTDTLVEDVHFSKKTSPTNLGHKALAVNLSDLAAMGARPQYTLLSITIPTANQNWLKQFADGFWNLADKHSVCLIGGDTTRGPLSITVTAIGQVTNGLFLKRNGAKAGDDVWVSGTVGGAAVGLLYKEHRDTFFCSNTWSRFEQFLDTPTPRVDLGQAISGIATSAIDVSDGLSQDIDHVLRLSDVGADIEYFQIPCETELKRFRNETKIRNLMLSGGG